MEVRSPSRTRKDILFCTDESNLSNPLPFRGPHKQRAVGWLQGGLGRVLSFILKKRRKVTKKFWHTQIKMYFCRDTHIMRPYSISDQSRKRHENDSKTTRKKNEEKSSQKAERNQWPVRCAPATRRGYKTTSANNPSKSLQGRSPQQGGKKYPALNFNEKKCKNSCIYQKLLVVLQRVLK